MVLSSLEERQNFLKVLNKMISDWLDHVPSFQGIATKLESAIGVCLSVCPTICML